MIPAISATRDSASEKAGFYMAGQADTSAQEAKAGDGAGGAGKSGDSGKSGKSEGSDGSDASGTSGANAADADAEGSDGSGADGAGDGADGAGQADAGSDSQDGEGADGAGEPSDEGDDQAADGDGVDEADSDGDGAGAGDGDGAGAGEGAGEGAGASSGSATKKSADGALTFSGKLEDVTGKVTLKVDVEAPEGALPEGAAMEVSAVKRAKVEDAVGEAIAGAAERATSGEDATDAERVAAERARDKVESIQAVDISFRDAEGAEVEPSAPITVKIASPQVERAVDAAATAERDEQAAGVPRETAAKPLLVHIDDAGRTEVVDTLNKAQLEDREMSYDAGELVFDSGDFSVYAIVYTVDFHYEVDGKSYDFSMPGGGFASLTELVEALGLVDDPQQFVSEVENLEFSNPDLIWIGKVDDDTTIGALKDANGLECEYSAELTSEELANIDAQTIEADDWALISVKPFESEETLVITMANGDTWTIKVTDYQNADAASDFDGETKFAIWSKINNVCYALKADGSTAVINESDIDNLGQEYQWTVTFGWNHSDEAPRYYIRPVSNTNTSLSLNYGGQPLVADGAQGIRIDPAEDQTWILTGWNNTRLFFDESNTKYIGIMDGSYTPVHFSALIQLTQYEFTVESNNYTQGGVSGTDIDGTNRQVEETFTTITNTVTNPSDDKTNKYYVKASPLTQKYMFDHWELNGDTLYWDSAQNKIVLEANENTTTAINVDSEGVSTISASTLTIPYNKSTLTAHFRRNPEYDVPDDDKDGRPIDETISQWLQDLLNEEFPLNKEATQKTAELYDYENRIYRVDLTAQSNLSALANTVKLGFVLDVSASMKFPSKLEMVSATNNTATTTDKTQQLSLELYKINDSDETKRRLDQDTVYYIIADKANTATVDKIFYQGDSWRFTDASKNDTTVINNDTKFHSSDSTGMTYPIYMAGDPVTTEDLASPEGDLLGALGLNAGDPRPRALYLQRSMRTTVTELQAIMNKISVANDPEQASKVLVAWNTFNGVVNASDHVFKSPATVSFSYAYAGGTSTDLALGDACDFYWGSDADTSRYAILITDGAPQKSSQAIPSSQVAEAATSLKTRGTETTSDDVNLITVGLSMGDVRRGEVLLYDIATTDENNDPYYYEAESGDELEKALAEIIRLTMVNAIVEGNVTDTVNEAFYPVDKATGAPLEDGAKIDLQGNLIEGTPTGPYGVISESNGTYTVTWSEQEFSWDGWHGTVYEKAKEDFYGGNAVRTNDPDNPAQVASTGYKLESGDTAIELNQATKTAGTKTFETPRVNVNELDFTQNSTSWTVYLGESVNPREQLEQLYNNIEIHEPVTGAVDTDGDGLPDKVVKDTDGNVCLYYPVEESDSDAREGAASGTRVYYYLKDLIKKLNGGNDPDWDRLIELADETGDENTGLIFTYDRYGQDNPGTFTVKLTKDLSSMENPPNEPLKNESRATTETGKPVESYTLSVKFSPEYAHIPAGQGGDGSLAYHTGTFGLSRYGNAAGTEESKNTHVINVFSKGLQIIKSDDALSQTLTGAKFELYRTARTGETGVSLSGVEGSYTKVADLDASGNGAAKKDPLEKLNSNEKYYLVETEAPAGYNMLASPILVNLSITDSYVPVPHNPQPDGTSQPTTPASGPYDWTETAVLTLGSGTDPVQVVDAKGNVPTDEDGNPISGQVSPDSGTATVYYKILNSAGKPLPNTGGSGTMPLYLVGTLLVIAGAICLLRRRNDILQRDGVQRDDIRRDGSLSGGLHGDLHRGLRDGLRGGLHDGVRRDGRHIE